MAVDKDTGLDDDLWTVQLRDDQMDCVIECLSWLIERHDERVGVLTSSGIDRFAHTQAKARIGETLAEFTQIGHRG